MDEARCRVLDVRCVGAANDASTAASYGSHNRDREATMSDPKRDQREPDETVEDLEPTDEAAQDVTGGTDTGRSNPAHTTTSKSRVAIIA